MDPVRDPLDFKILSAQLSTKLLQEQKNNLNFQYVTLKMRTWLDATQFF